MSDDRPQGMSEAVWQGLKGRLSEKTICGKCGHDLADHSNLGQQPDQPVDVHRCMVSNCDCACFK